MSQTKYAVTTSPAPVLNSPDFEAVFGGTDRKNLKTDKEGLIRDLEYTALKGTVFQILDENDKGDHEILHVKAFDYDYGNELYIDSRFVKIYSTKPILPEKILPSKKEIFTFLDNAVGSKYIWGGNCIAGIEQMLEYYKPAGNLNDETLTKWELKGCDCSGLMYEATNGFTERNTSKLIHEGVPVLIEGMTAEEIANILKPLDMIVWVGHVIYVYDENTAIQSALSKGGVVKTDLAETLKSLMEKRTPVNDYDSGTGERFVVRRWYQDNEQFGN